LRSSTTRSCAPDKTLGHNGALPPYLSAWLGDLVFGVVGVWMIARQQMR
jgi:lipopolysaccharide export LptBFGC system permease protein LptF